VALLLALLVAVPVSLAMVMARGDLLSTLFQRHASIMLLVDPETGEIVDANQAAGDFYGYPVATLRRMTIQQINALEPEAVMAERQRPGPKRATTSSLRIASPMGRCAPWRSIPPR